MSHFLSTTVWCLDLSRCVAARTLHLSPLSYQCTETSRFKSGCIQNCVVNPVAAMNAAAAAAAVAAYSTCSYHPISSGSFTSSSCNRPPVSQCSGRSILPVISPFAHPLQKEVIEGRRRESMECLTSELRVLLLIAPSSCLHRRRKASNL